MRQIRTSNCKIKNVYESQSDSDIKTLNVRIASLLTDSYVEAARLAIAVEPNHLYIVTSGLHGDEANDNGDFFLWSELLKRKKNGMRMYETWVDCPVLENHNMESKRGGIIDTWPLRTEKSVDMLLRIDERINPNMVKGIRNGSISGTSMGVMVGHSYCGLCKHLAYDETEWCAHLSPRKLNIKGKRYTGQDGGLFPDKIGMMCYEDNRDLVGVEDSIISLGDPADPKALIREVLAHKKRLKLAN